MYIHTSTSICRAASIERATANLYGVFSRLQREYARSPNSTNGQ